MTRAGAPLLGSPIDLQTVRAMQGFVEARSGGLSGWAWHPHDPDRDPVLSVAGRRITASEPLDDPEFGVPLARPRRFSVAAASLPPGPVEVTGLDGRPVLGSPIDPGLERRSAAGAGGRLQPGLGRRRGTAADRHFQAAADRCGGAGISRGPRAPWPACTPC